MALIADDRREGDAQASADHRLARDALAGLDRLLSAAPPSTSLPVREIAALIRLIRAANDRDPTLGQ